MTSREIAGGDWPVDVLHIGDLDPSGVHMPLALAEDVEAFVDGLAARWRFIV